MMKRKFLWVVVSCMMVLSLIMASCGTTTEEEEEEEVMEEEHIKKGNSGYFWVVQEAGIQKWLDKVGKEYYATWVEGGSYEQLIKALEENPVIFGTKKLGRLKGGHIILLNEHVNYYFHVNDPYGDARIDYKNISGGNIVYTEDFLLPYCRIAGDNGFRFIKVERV